MKTVIHVMRHGEVDNPDGILYGRLPGYGLTDLGIEMAEAVAEYFVDSGADITHVVASPLLRAQMSAAPTDHRPQSRESLAFLLRAGT